MPSPLDITPVEALAREVTEAHNLVLYDVVLGQRRGRPVLQVTIDRHGAGAPGTGVTVAECETISRELEQILDAEDPLPLAYVLEVSSPGIERPLTQPRHYTLAVGQQVQLMLTGKIRNQNTWEGVLAEFRGDTIVLRLPPKSNKRRKKGQPIKYPPMATWETLQIPLDKVHKAKTVFPTLPLHKLT